MSEIKKHRNSAFSNGADVGFGIGMIFMAIFLSYLGTELSKIKSGLLEEIIFPIIAIIILAFVVIIIGIAQELDARAKLVPPPPPSFHIAF
ncbi:MAG: hypothetical protein QXL52_04655 [Nitrososphaerales archaeon]